MLFKRDEVIKDLREFVAEVSFTKVDGQNRVMRCTLKPELLPAKYVNEEIEAEKNFHAENLDVIRAWDVQKAAWRSFRMDSVIYFQIIDAY